jgi:uncharacterized protein YycO
MIILNGNQERSMSIEEVSKHLKSCDLIFSTTNKPVGRIISFFTKNPYSHVGIYAGSGDVIEARYKKGVKKTKIDSILGDEDHYKVLIIRPTLKNKQVMTILEYAHDKIGQEYDVWQIVQFFWKILRHRVGKSSMDDKRDEFICYELVSRAFLRAGVRFGPYVDSILAQDIINSEVTHEVNFP